LISLLNQLKLEEHLTVDGICTGFFDGGEVFLSLMNDFVDYVKKNLTSQKSFMVVRTDRTLLYEFPNNESVGSQLDLAFRNSLLAVRFSHLVFFPKSGNSINNCDLEITRRRTNKISVQNGVSVRGHG
jgi:HJR/Mrr/RecB family endonuclease